MTIAFATNMASSSKRQDDEFTVSQNERKLSMTNVLLSECKAELQELDACVEKDDEKMNEVREKIVKLNAQKGRLRMSLAGL
jgi:peptidoglycan hydrolase CwlO-like protein